MAAFQCGAPLLAQRALARPLRTHLCSRTRTRTMSSLIPASEAHSRKSAGWRHLDVRTAEEFARLRAPNSVNVAFMNKTDGGMVANPSFLSEVAATFPKDTQLLVSCASGKRSAMATAALTADGYSTVADVEGGMAAWAETPGLPTESGAPTS